MKVDENVQRIRATLISLISGIVILVIKFIAWRPTNSSALKSDAYESTVNVVSAAFALGAIIFAGKPADEDHPYGHGKIENFSAAFEGGLISLASLLILYEGVMSIILGNTLKSLDSGILLNLFAGFLNGLLGWFLIRNGKKLKSHAIEADGHHVMSDFITSIAVAVGVGVVWLTGWKILDSIIAIAVGLWLAVVGFKLVKKSSSALLDIEDPDTVKKIVDTINKNHPDEIITIHGLRTFRSGRLTHVDVHIVVPEYLSVRDAHDHVELFGKMILNKSDLEGEFHSHIDPCRKLFCENCSVKDCKIRVKNFLEKPRLTVKGAITPDPDEDILSSV
jgi:cation diffusion facilitator family transporter